MRKDDLTFRRLHCIIRKRYYFSERRNFYGNASRRRTGAYRMVQAAYCNNHHLYQKTQRQRRRNRRFRRRLIKLIITLNFIFEFRKEKRLFKPFFFFADFHSVKIELFRSLWTCFCFLSAAYFHFVLIVFCCSLRTFALSALVLGFVRFTFSFRTHRTFLLFFLILPVLLALFRLQTVLLKFFNKKC